MPMQVQVAQFVELEPKHLQITARTKRLVAALKRGCRSQ
jgi:hypothetical protein